MKPICDQKIMWILYKSGGLISLSLFTKESFSTRKWLHLIDLLVKGDPGELPSNPNCCKTIGCSPQTPQKQVLIAKDSIYITHWVQMSWVGTYIEPSPLWTSVFVTGRYSVHYQSRNLNTNLSSNHLTRSGVLLATYANTIVAQS